MFKCGFYEKEITPPLGCNIPGYANLRAASGVKDRLMAKACVISDGEKTVALVAVDALHMSADMRDEIAKRINEYTDIPEENVLVAAVHTHTGIPEKTYSADAGAVKNMEGYHTLFTKLIADCGILAYKRLQASKISFGQGNVEGISFCRDYIMKNSTPRTNPGRLNPDIIGPASPIDTELPVLFMKKADGTPFGAIISFACHLDCVDGIEYSGDFPSEVSKQLKRLYGNDFVTLFFIGTAGDINHFNVKTAGDLPDHYRKMGSKVVGEIIKTMSFSAELTDERLNCKFERIKINRLYVSDERLAEAKNIIATVKEVPGVKIAADGTSRELYDLMMARKTVWVLENMPPYVEAPLQLIEIGDVKFFGFPSEIFCEFGTRLKKSVGGRCVVATCCNDAYGYIPTREMVFDTVYESSPGSNRLEIDAGYKMVEKFIEMCK